jgi:hypothetical protein
VEITTTTNPNVTIPLLDIRGIATGIDIRKVAQTGILSVIGSRHHEPAGRVLREDACGVREGGRRVTVARERGGVYSLACAALRSATTF